MGILENLLPQGKRLPILSGVDSVIGESAKFKGELVTQGSVNISGEFDGKIKAEGEVIISSGGRVVGEIQAGSIVVSGRVDGNITARSNLEVAKSGRVHGDITGGKIIIDEGAVYQGRVKVLPEKVEEEVISEKMTEPRQTAQPQIFPEI
ncbi:MAG: bactofilin family protein [Candidatus Margulisiibacteriota bacterium]